MKRWWLMLSVMMMLAPGSVAHAAGPDLADAKDNYTTFCVKCHGASGQGNGPAAASLHTKPRNYTDCALMAKIPDATLFKAIKDGGASVGLSPEMPSWSKGFDDDEIRGLVAYVRTFCQK